jgi:nitrous oxidase accessory protein
LKILLKFLLVLAAVSSDPAQAAQHTVRPGDSIGAAIRAAQPGDVVSVERGHYVEHLVIDKRLSLIGVDRPTLSAGGRGDVIRVQAPDAVIQGFIIRDSGADLGVQNAGIYVEPGADRLIIRNNDLVYNLFGVWLNQVKDAQLIGNLITGKRDLASAQRGNGIQLYNTTGAQIIGNHISFARDGIYVDVSHHAVFRGNKIHHVRYGAHYMNSHHNLWEGNESYLNRGGLALMQVRNQVVRNNTAWGNTDHGIMLRSIQDSVIEHNVVAGNSRGLFVYDAEYNVLRGNLVIGNRVGVHLWAGSIHNEAEGNDFVHNRDQIRYVAARDEEWGKRQGNYWSNYAGWDADGDGVGDVPYQANDVVDRLTWKYPLVKLLLNSPAVHSLRLIAKQFPLLRSPSVVDKHPRIRPFHSDWSAWIDKRRH